MVAPQMQKSHDGRLLAGRGVDGTAPVTGQLLGYDGSKWAPTSGGGALASSAAINGFRLTTESGVPQSTGDRAAQGRVYLTPFTSNRIGIYDGATWIERSSAEVYIDLAGLTANKNYDIFAYWTGAAVALELSAAWASDSARTDAISRQDGVYVKTGSTGRRFVGTLRATAAATTEDTVTQRFLWNHVNRTTRHLYREDATSHTYMTGAGRYWNNDATQRVEFVQGLIEDTVDFSIGMDAYHNSGNIASCGAGLNRTNAFDSTPVWMSMAVAATTFTQHGRFNKYPAQGFNYVAAVENGQGVAGTLTWGSYQLQGRIQA